jgi:glycosyltransferase involved in cell wall biosynthesis
MPEVLDSMPRARLTVVGGGSLEASLHDRADRLGLGPVVRFLGSIPRAEIASLYSAAALCVLPSLWSENSPLVAYECLHSGLPMAGSRTGGIPELVGEQSSGFTFTPGDAHELAQGIVRFLRLPRAERDRMSACASQRAKEFQKDPLLARIEDLYRELHARQIPVDAEHRLVGPEFFSILEHLAADLAARGLGSTSMQIIRDIARSLGLPKVLGD